MDGRTEALLAWYDLKARSMPWRGSRDPYAIWVSETMLQQTRVDTVTRYYDRFLASFPTVKALAEAKEEDVLKAWEGLGYYSRARNLQAGARQVMADFDGQLPADPAALRKIRGIGPYTAGAVASIAFGIPVPAVDGNVIRVVSRVFAVTGNMGEAAIRHRVEELAAGLVPRERSGDHNQAMMDLGATVCLPGTPDCDVCPLRSMCEAQRQGIAEELPLLPGAKPAREIRYDLFLIRAGSRVLMRQRTEKMLQGLWCFPMMEGWETGETRTGEILKKWGLKTETMKRRGEAKHVFTHQIWLMKILETETEPEADPPAGYAFIPVTELERLAIPTAMKAARAMAGGTGRKTAAGNK